MGDLVLGILSWFLNRIADFAPPPSWTSLLQMGGDVSTVSLDGHVYSDPLTFGVYLIGRVNYFVPLDLLVGVIGVYFTVRGAVFLVKLARRMVWN